MAAENELFAGIDIGSTAVRIAVGQRVRTGEKGQLHIIGAAEVPTEGVTRGTINSIEDAVSSVSNCIEKVERMTGAQVSSAWVSVSGAHVIMVESKGVVPVAKPDGEIREDDVERVIDAAQAVTMPANHEVLHVIPKGFTVDGQKGVKDPVGMTGMRLEGEVQIVQGQSAHIKNLTKCVYRTGVDIERLVLGVLATADAVTTSRQRELGVAVVNIGGASTTCVVFEQGDVLQLTVIPIGSEHVTSDIAIGLRTSIDVAERAKVQYADAFASAIPKSEQINLRELGADDDELVSRRYVCDIVQARTEEVIERIEKDLKKIGRAGLLPAGIVFTGGGAKLTGLVDFAKQKLRLPASLGIPLGMTSITDRINDTAFSTAIGLAAWGANETPEGAKRRGLNVANAAGKAADKVKKWFGAMVH